MSGAKANELSFDASGVRCGIIASRFNNAIVEGLLDGALQALQRHGVEETNIYIARTPGAFELPLAAALMAQSKRFDALIALAVVIRGATPHFEYVSGACTDGIARVSLRYQLPIGFGVLTVNTLEQAIERAGMDQENKGAEAALAALEMIGLSRQFA